MGISAVLDPSRLGIALSANDGCVGDYGFGIIRKQRGGEMNDTKKIADALDLAFRYGVIDGAHHKMWVIDQMVRILAGDAYEERVKIECAGVDGPETYSWDTGIAP